MALVVATIAQSYVFITNDAGFAVKWRSNAIPVTINVNNFFTLTDGTTQATCIQNAMTSSSRGWNQYLSGIAFVPTIGTGTTGHDGNNANEIFFSSTAYDYSWDDSTLAVTTVWVQNGDTRVEGDILLNNAFAWDSYRGAQKSGVFDLQRVVLHELGHVLGLDHPDEHGQSVTAIMNSVISDTDSLQADDIAGAQALYGVAGQSPANDNFSAAITIDASIATQTIPGSNLGATKETNEPNHGGDRGGHSVWWKMTPGQSGTLNLTTAGSNFDTTLAVYTGQSVDTLNLVTEDIHIGPAQHSSAVSASVTGGTTYYIAIDGYSADYGSISLNVSLVIPQPPVITLQPVSQTVLLGSPVAFSVSATGVPAPSYQWYLDGSPISGANAATYSIASVSAGSAGTYTVTASNGVPPAATSTGAVLTVQLPSGVVSVAATSAGTIFLRADGTRWVMGANFSGELGTNTATTFAVPTQIDGNNLFIAAGSADMAVVKTDGTLQMSGDNGHGQLGDGTQNNRATLAAVQGGFGVVAVSVFQDFSLFELADGSILAVGNDANGEFGDGTTTSRSFPIIMTKNVRSFAAGGVHSLYVDVSGDAWGAGDAEYDQLNGELAPPLLAASTINALPLKIASGVAKVFAGAHCSFFLRNDGSLWQVGSMDNLQLAAPVQVATNVTSVAAGPSHYVFIKTDGTLWGAGDNSDGQLGVAIGANNLYQTPIKIADHVAAAAVGSWHTVYVTDDGSLWGMGLNSWNQVSSAYAYQVPTPTLITQGTLVTPQAPINIHTLATVDGVFVAWSGQLGTTRYHIWRAPSSAPGSGVEIGSSDGGQIAFMDATAVPGVSYSYWVTASNSAGTSAAGVATSGQALSGVAPVFTQQPVTATLPLNVAGQAELSVAARGAPTPDYRWQIRGGTDAQWINLGPLNPTFTGVNTAGLTVHATLTGNPGWRFRCIATNLAGQAISAEAQLLAAGVPLPPTLILQPASVTVPAGGQAIFNAGVQGGTTPYSYQWLCRASATGSWQPIGMLHGTSYSGDLGPTLTITDCSKNLSGVQFTCTIYDANSNAITTDPATLTVTSIPVKAADFNADGHPDLLWENTAGIDRAIWYMNGASIAGFDYLAGIDGVWKIVGTADFDGDGQTDIAWENTSTGDRTCWYMNGKAIASFGYFALVDPAWHIAAIGDFDGDGKPDLVWENTVTGDRAVWFLDGVAIKSFGYIAGIDPVWHIVGAADFDGDGQTDLVWENLTTGDRTIWYMNGATLSSFGYIGNVPDAWHIAMVADMDGDGHPDLVWENRTTGDRAIWLMNNATLLSSPYLAFVDPAWHIAP
ncbi:MAG TPA: immunoglobulin domain-containing protein [Lacunisphaera sp.]|nr:immunoglobulin domain-containing protein [Lacunisphaera sp.]